MGSARDVAKKIRQARASGGGNWIKQGKGLFAVKALKLEDLYKGDTFISELYVDKSESYADAEEVKAGEGPEKANAPGSSVTFLCQLDENPDVAYPNMKAFLYALLDESDESLDAAAKARIAAGNVPEAWVKESGLTAAQWTGDDEFGEVLTSIVAKAQPCRGMVIGYDTFRKTAEKSGRRLTLPRWEHQKQTSEQIAARRALLDGQAEAPAAAAPAA